ncbi:hypothetical protein CYMTET_12727 [Cymbomonas tetramitiformis]|uniref:Uncharacterized protein n=1 Tax=Cymbomonas tetramitiformis TaxID=36881 RepID=A0AAE0GJU7_9CHLO|nr:hypothetical protein CYMTET_12727 [Cymbomonas tetramitiformis]
MFVACIILGKLETMRSLFLVFGHTAEELEKATKVACADFGLGEYELVAGEEGVIGVDTVSDYIHATCFDNASNMTVDWKCFDGHECTDHTLALVVRAFLEHPVVKKVFSKLRDMTTHFNHSVLGGNLLEECQKRHNLPESKPPQDNDTRTGWGGACKQATWYIVNQIAVQMYDVENPSKAATAVANPDGSVYKAHQLALEEWSIVQESRHVLAHVRKDGRRSSAAHEESDCQPHHACRWSANLHLPFSHEHQVREANGVHHHE